MQGKIYHYFADDGEHIERFHWENERPETVEQEGKVFHLGVAARSRSPEGIVREYGHVAYNLPLNAEGAPHYDAHGRPCFESRRQVDEFKARHNMKWGEG